MKGHGLQRVVGLVVFLTLLLAGGAQARMLAPLGQIGPAAAHALRAQDIYPPAVVANLSASTGTAAGAVDLSWIAPGDDDSTGTATAYIVRYNTSSITESNWNTSIDVTGEPVPGSAGSVEGMTVSGLAPSRAYYFALKAQDEVPNMSGVSNSPRAFARASPNAVFLPLVAASDSSLPPEVPDTTVALPFTTTQYLSAVSSDGAVFTFTQSTPALEALVPGDIVVGDVAANAPDGFLRQVVSVATVGGQVVLETQGTTLEDAIETGAAELHRTLAPGRIRQGILAPGVTLASAPETPDGPYFLYTLDEVVLYDADGDGNTTDDQIVANGSIRLEPSFYFRVVVRSFHLEELAFTTSANETAELEITAEVEQPLIHVEREVAQHVFSPITIMIGPVPVVIVPVLTVNVGLDGSIHVGVAAGVTQLSTLTGGLQYTGGTWSAVSSFTNQFYCNPPTLSAGLDMKGYAGAQLSLLLYGVVGPYAEANLYLELEADPMAQPWWTLFGGLQVPVGIKIEVLSHLIADYEATVIDYRLVLAQSSLPNNPPNVPADPSPANGAAGQDPGVNLRWSGSDLDGDVLTYTVFLEAGDSTPDVAVADAHPGTTFNPAGLAPNTRYYWRIVARDEHGATTAGPVWVFTTASGSLWRITRVDSSGNVGRYASLALDATGRPHISYCDASQGHLKHAWYTGTSWQTEVVDSSGCSTALGESSTSLTLDAANRPHIAYRANQNLRYAWYDGSTWHTETVDSSGDVGRYASLRLDASGLPRISHRDYTNRDLKYSWHDGTSWANGTVDSTGDVGRNSSLALDSAGRPHIGYFDATNGLLRYARFDGSGWQIETVDEAGSPYPFAYTSLVLDASDRPHISYYRQGSLQYTYYDGASWYIETVDNSADVGRHSSLALDSVGWPHISYMDSATGNLKYAYGNGTTWAIVVVDNAIGIWGDDSYTSLALDSSDQPHIAYYDNANGDLIYAYLQY